MEYLVKVEIGFMEGWSAESVRQALHKSGYDLLSVIPDRRNNKYLIEFVVTIDKLREIDLAKAHLEDLFKQEIKISCQVN